MLKLRQVPLTLTIWLFEMTVCFAQETAPARSAWFSLENGAEKLWACILVAAILTGALLVHLIIVLRERHVNPPELIETLNRTILAGNYQEAWEACSRWRHAALGRILQPAMERIGQGKAAAEGRLTQQEHREMRHITILLWGMLCGAATTAVLGLIAGGRAMHSVSSGAMSADGARLRALATGDAALSYAVAVAVALPVLAAWSLLRVRARILLKAAGKQGLDLIAGMPYEDIEGVRIGKDFHAGTLLGDTAVSQTSLIQVSRELTTQCPSCNSPINSSRDSCPQCGQLLVWS